MNSHRFSRNAGIAALALLALPGFVLAQGQPQTSTDEAATSSESDEVIGEVTVFAQKRAENLQDVPISVAAVGPQALEDLNAVTLQSLQGTVPNVEIGNFSNTPNTAVFTIRGIGVIEPDPYAGNTVGIVTDGVPQFFSMGALLDLYDVERIEVLRGPQGTLFGANTTGGVVNVINGQPIDRFEGKLDVGYGNRNHTQIGGVLNTPLSETVSNRFVVSHDDRDGWVTNVVNGKDMGKRNVTVFRDTLKWSPSDDSDVILSGQYDRARNGSPVVVAGDVPGEAEFVPAGFRNMYESPCLPAGSRCNAPGKYLSAHDPGAIDPATGEFVDPIKDQSDMDTYRGTLTMNFRGTALGDVTSITGYKQFKLFEYTDQDGTPVFLDDTRRTTKGWQVSQELRTSFDLNDKINILVGGFYLKDHFRHQQDFRLNFAGGVTYNPDGTVTYGLPGLFQLNVQDQDNDSISAFTQAYVKLSDRLRLQAGIRYTHEKTEMLAFTDTLLALSGATTFDGTNPDGTPDVLTGSARPPKGRESWNNVGWKLGLDYRLNDDALLYGYWARGFKSGGFTGRIGIPQDIGPYDPEKVDTYEVGLKSEFFDRHLRTNLAAFYTNYRDMQLAQIYFIGSGANIVQGNTILNAAKSHIKGFEAEVTAVPARGLTINASLAYLSAKYSEFPYLLPSGDILDLKGERLQNAPKWSGSVGVGYEFPIGSMGGRLGAQYSYTAEKLYSSIIDTERASIQPVKLVNANADLEVSDRLTIGLWATNLLDKRYLNSLFDAPGTLGLTNYAPPRQYGLSAKYAFGK